MLQTNLAPVEIQAFVDMGTEEHSSERVSIFFFRFSINDTCFPPEAAVKLLHAACSINNTLRISEVIRFPGSSRYKSSASEGFQV